MGSIDFSVLNGITDRLSLQIVLYCIIVIVISVIYGAVLKFLKLPKALFQFILSAGYLLLSIRSLFISSSKKNSELFIFFL